MYTHRDSHARRQPHTETATHRDSHTQRQTHTETATQRQAHTDTGTQNTHMYRIKNFPALLLVKMVGYGFQNSIFVHTVIDATVGGAGGRAVVGWAGSSTGEQAA